MAKRSMPINVRSDRPHGDRLTRQLTGLQGVPRTEFLHTMARMTEGAIPAADCSAVLNARYELYALRLGDCGMVLLVDLDGVSGRWTLLDLLTVDPVDAGAEQQAQSLEIAAAAPAEVACRHHEACCAAHGLIAPARERHRGALD